MWNYLYFVVHLRMKEKTELTGPESYVYDLIKDHIENKVRAIPVLTTRACVNDISTQNIYVYVCECVMYNHGSDIYNYVLYMSVKKGVCKRYCPRAMGHGNIIY